MMKEEINLLPPAVKRARFGRLVGRRLSHLFWRLVLVVGIVLVAMASVYGVLYQTNQRLQTSTARAEPGGGEAPTVRNFNQLIRAMHQRVTDSVLWGPFTGTILKLVPPEVHLTHLEATTFGQRLVIEGRSSSRAAVATLEQRLKAVAGVEKVEAPLQNQALGREGMFSFTLQRKIPQP